MHRFVVSQKDIENGCIIITGDDLKHLRQVLRLGTGDKIGAFDGLGMEYEAQLTEVSKDRAVAVILSSFEAQSEPATRVTLFQGLPKGDKMDLIIQKAVELGVHKIVPVITQRTVVQLDKKSKEKKAERWSKIAREAAKQCHRAYVPEVAIPEDFDKILEEFKNYDSTVMFYEGTVKKCLKELLKCYTINKIKDIALLIGPEGGFTELEVEKCRTAGIDIVSLGKRILRTETAAITSLSIIMYEMGELQP